MTTPVHMGKRSKPGAGGRACKSETLDSRFQMATVVPGEVADRMRNQYGKRNNAAPAPQLGRFADPAMTRRRGY